MTDRRPVTTKTIIYAISLLTILSFVSAIYMHGLYGANEQFIACTWLACWERIKVHVRRCSSLAHSSAAVGERSLVYLADNDTTTSLKGVPVPIFEWPAWPCQQKTEKNITNFLDCQ